MSALIEPNLHPVLVHFAYALSATSMLSYLIAFLASKAKWRDSLIKAANWMLAFAAFFIVATIAAGFQAYYTVGHDGPSHAAMTTHRNWAVPSGVAVLSLALWRWLRRDRQVSIAFILLFGLAVSALTVTAWWGGRIVYEFGLGVKKLPQISGDGHDHDHGEGVNQGAPNLTNSGMDGHDHGGAGNHDHDVTNGEPENKSSVPHEHGSNEQVSDTEFDPSKASDHLFEALKNGDSAAVGSLLADDVLIIEGGHAQTSKDDYMAGHMKSDMAFLPHMETAVLDRTRGRAGNRAWVVTYSRSKGNYKGKDYDHETREFLLLRKQDGEWKIAMIEWAEQK